MKMVFYVTWANVTDCNIVLCQIVMVCLVQSWLQSVEGSSDFSSTQPSKYSFRLFLSGFLFWQAVNLMLRRWQCTHLGGPRETAAGSWTCPNRCVPSPTEHAVPSPSLLSFSSPSSFLFHLIQQDNERWQWGARGATKNVPRVGIRHWQHASGAWN